MVIAIVKDLLFRAKIREAAKTAADVRFVSRIEELDALLNQPVGLALVDLQIDSLDPIGAIHKIRAISPLPRIVGFYSHIDKEIAEKARQAQADTVMPRSRFVSELSSMFPG